MSIASVSTRVLLHNTDTWGLTHSFGDSTTSLRNISWSNDGKYLLQVNPKGLVEILTINEKDLRVIQNVSCQNTCAAVFDRETHRQIGIGSYSGQVLIWDTKYKNIRKSYTAPNIKSPVKFLDFNLKNNWVASALENGEVTVYGLTTNSEICSFRIPKSKSVSAMHFHFAYRSIIGLASDEGCLLLRDLAIGKDRLFLERVHSSPVSDFVFGLVNPHMLATCGYDRVFQLYDQKSAARLAKVQTKQSLTCMDINEKNELVLGTKKGVILIYDLRNYDCPVRVVTDHSSEIKKVLFRPLVKTSTDSSLREPENPMLSQYSNKSERSDTPEYFNITTSSFEKRKTQLEENVIDAKKGKEDTDGEKSDSFLAIMGLADVSDHRQETFEKSQTSNTSSTLENCNVKTLFPSKTITDKNGSSIFSAKSSTPLADNVDIIGTPSPITKIIKPRNVLDENSNKENHMIGNQVYNIPVKGMERIHNIDNINNMMASLGNELKDLIRYSAAELSEEFRNSHLQMGLALTKQKLFLESEINTLGEKIQDMQRVQKVILEENQRLLLEIEMMKSSPKFNL